MGIFSKKSFLDQVSVSRTVIEKLAEMLETAKSKMKSQIIAAKIEENAKIEIAQANIKMLEEDEKELEDVKKCNSGKCKKCVGNCK